MKTLVISPVSELTFHQVLGVVAGGADAGRGDGHYEGCVEGD